MKKEVTIISISEIPSDLLTSMPSFYDGEKFKVYMEDMLAKHIRRIPINHWMYFQEAKSIVSSFLSPSKYILNVGSPHSQGQKWTLGSTFFETIVSKNHGPYSIDDWNYLLVNRWPDEAYDYVCQLANAVLGYAKPLIILEDVFVDFLTAYLDTKFVKVKIIPLSLGRVS